MMELIYSPYKEGLKIEDYLTIYFSVLLLEDIAAK